MSLKSDIDFLYVLTNVKYLGFADINKKLD